MQQSGSLTMVAAGNKPFVRQPYRKSNLSYHKLKQSKLETITDLNISAWKSVGISTSETIPFHDLTPIKKYFDNKIGL